ncbi:GcrA family cell cycle regulator [Candidatus Pelagibacter sp.]|nr:GcrA family cell cycle regulator [Candidatus Pelagibacter sp.]
MSWTEEKVNKLKELWGKGNTASEIASIIGGLSRNAIIGKAHRLNLSKKISDKNFSFNKNLGKVNSEFKKNQKIGRRSKFKSLLIEKDFEPAKNLTLEELTEETCKYMDHDTHPNELGSTFCGRKTVSNSKQKFSYCPLHLMIIFQPKGKKEDIVEKDDEVPQFIEKKIKSA